MTNHRTITLTEREARMVEQCLAGEVENDDGLHGDYFAVLRRVLKKLRQAREQA